MLNEEGAVLSWYATATDIEDRKRTESLLAAEMQTLQMIADGASLTDILNHVCTSIDLQISPSVTTILLMDSAGQKLWPTAGPRVPPAGARDNPAANCSGYGIVRYCRILEDTCHCPGCSLRAKLAGGVSRRCPEQRDTVGMVRANSDEGQSSSRDVRYLFKRAASADGCGPCSDRGGRAPALIAIERQRSQEGLRSALDTIRKSEEELRRMIDAVARRS